MLSLSSPANAGSSACPNQDAKSGDASKGQLATSMKCLVNKERTKRGLRKLHSDSHLVKVEKAHVKLMLRKDCFQHVCSGEKDLTARVSKSGYLDGARRFSFVENLAYDKTPKQAIDDLMDDPVHRANVLYKPGRDIGVATGKGAPRGGLDDQKFETFGMVIADRDPH